jgi:hypothetical protein
MAKDRTRNARRREPQPERAYMSLSELAFWSKITASAMERVHGSVTDTMQYIKRLERV